MVSVEDRCKALMPHNLWLQERTRKIVIAMLTAGRPMRAATLKGATGLSHDDALQGLWALNNHNVVTCNADGWFLKERAD